MRRCISIVFALVIIMTVASAGCFDNIKLAPSEVQNRGNIIAIDSEYVDPATVVELFLSPETYQPGLFRAIDKFLPRENPVVEVGVGLGVAMADVSQKLSQPKRHVAVTPNPYMIPLLEKTCQLNSLPIQIEQKAISYHVGEGTNVPFVVSKNLQSNHIAIDETEEIVMVPATTVSGIISKTVFADAENVTLIVENPDLIQTIFENEPEIYNHVSTIIALTGVSTNLDLSKILNEALLAGYSPLMISDPDSIGIRALVFKR